MAYQSEIEKLEQRYRENPDQWFAALADSYRKAGSLDLALDVVRAGLDKRPNYVSGYIVLGRCLLQKPDDGAAAQAFEKVLSLDAENVIALKALSEVSERAGRLPDAVRWLSRLLEVDPMNDEAEQALARLKQAAASAPPVPVPAADAADATGGAGVAAAAAGVSPVAGFEATIAEKPAAPEPEPMADFAIEKSHGATEAPELGVVSLEPLELEGTAAPAASAATPAGGAEGVGGLESMAFEPPPAGETPPPAPDLEPMEFTPPEPAAAPAGGDVAAQPFDDQLAWGTGQRLSGAVSQADVEEAEHTHEPSLEPVLEEPSTGGDLPLIYPDEVTPGGDTGAREAEGPGDSEPEPVVTETMAELYARQGLMAEARDIYRKLATQRPGDAAVASRLTELEGAVSGRRSSGGARMVEARGGPSARDFLAGVFGGTAAASGGTPAESTAPMDAAYGGASPEPAPTRRASDEVSLAAVFGEEPSPVRQPAAPAQPAAKPAGQGFSFDEFFGGQRKPPAAPGTAGEETGEEDDDDFKRWLKGLKS